MKALILIGATQILLVAPAAAQSMDQAMPGMQMPAAKSRQTKKAQAKPGEKPRAHTHSAKAKSEQENKPVHDMSSMPEMDMKQMGASSSQSDATGADANAGHKMSSMKGMDMSGGSGASMGHEMATGALRCRPVTRRHQRRPAIIMRTVYSVRRVCWAPVLICVTREGDSAFRW